MLGQGDSHYYVVVAACYLLRIARALARIGEHVIAGTSRGLIVLDRRLRPVGYCAGAVESLGTDGQGLIVAAHTDGRLAAYTLGRPAGRAVP